MLLPGLAPAILTGFALAFARGVGEYGSVIFIAGNLPYVSEIAPLLIVIRLEEFDYAGADRDRRDHAGHLVRHAARHQPDPGLEPQEVRLCADPSTVSYDPHQRQRCRAAVTETPAGAHAR